MKKKKMNPSILLARQTLLVALIAAGIMVASTVGTAQEPSRSSVTSKRTTSSHLLDDLRSLNSEQMQEKASSLVAALTAELEEGATVERARSRRAAQEHLQEKIAGKLEKANADKMRIIQWLRDQKNELQRSSFSSEKDREARYLRLVKANVPRIDIVSRQIEIYRSQLNALDRRIARDAQLERDASDAVLIAELRIADVVVPELPERGTPAEPTRLSQTEPESPSDLVDSQLNAKVNALLTLVNQAGSGKAD